MSLPIPIWGVPISVWGLPFFCFFQSRTRSAFSRQTDNNTANTSTAIPIFNARDASGRTPVGSGRTPLESARAYASMPPDEAETEGAWVRTRWRAGRAGADWATCLRLLERAADDVALDGCGGRCLFVPGGELNEMKTIVFALYGCLPVIQTQQPTTNTCTRRRR